LLLVTPMAGSVGSLLGLNPYSSTSFLLSSSASFRCFRLRHKKRAASTSNATAATGTTTATAILPPAERPSDVLDAVVPDVARAATSDDLDDGRADVNVCGVIFVATAGPGDVLVMRIVRGSCLPSLAEDITTITEDGEDSMLGVDEVSGSGGLEDVAGGWADEIDSGDVDKEVESGGGGGGGEELERVRDGKEKVVKVAVKVGMETVYH
jgi:hypothetical protein